MHQNCYSFTQKDTEERGGGGEKDGVFGRDLGAGWGAELWGAEELEEPVLGSGGSRVGLGPGCQHGKGWKVQGLREPEKGLQRVRN